MIGEDDVARVQDQSAEPDLRFCRCSGCSARHHQLGASAVALWYLTSPSKQREEVCGTCANRRTAHGSREGSLTPMPDRGRRLAGRQVGGLTIYGVDAQEWLVCECFDQDCACGGTCTGRALYLWGGVDHDDWQYLCRTCCLRMLERGTPPNTSAVAAGDAPEEAATDA
jgi:hypothetical protein